MSISITTRYETHPGSNVGKYRARSLGRTASVRADQSLSNEDNHQLAAFELMLKFRNEGLVPRLAAFSDLVLDGTEDDGRHVWTI